MEQKHKAIRSPKLWVPSLYFAQGLPFFAVAIVAAQMLKSMGVANDDIAHWTAAIGAAWVFKPLWSPFLELASSKKIVVVAFQLLGGISLGLVALALHTPFWFAACIAMLALVAIASATHDIACDGLYITSLSDKEQAEYAGWTGTFFNAGKFIATGGLMLLAGSLEKPMAWCRRGLSVSACWRRSWSAWPSITAGRCRWRRTPSASTPPSAPSPARCWKCSSITSRSPASGCRSCSSFCSVPARRRCRPSARCSCARHATSAASV